MERGRMVSARMDDYRQLFIDWFDHREGVSYDVIDFADHYEIHYESERDGIGEELNEFIAIFEGPGKSMY